MYYIVYKTTCALNGMYYIGVHKTKNIEDGYIGSGKYLSRAIKKYGKEHFSREILYMFNNEQDMFAKETELVTEEIVKDSESYNCKLGGSANFYYINKNKLNQKAQQHLKHPNRCKNDQEYAAKFSNKMKEVTSLKKLNASMTPEQRKEAARKAAIARWNKKSGKCAGEATAGSAKP